MSGVDGLRRRVSRLEELRVGGSQTTLHFEDGSQRAIRSSAKWFFRIVAAMHEEKTSHSPSAALDDLNRLRREVEIEGDNAQLFYLARAMAVGPVPEPEEV